MKQRELLGSRHVKIIINNIADYDEVISRDHFTNFNNYIKSLKNNLNLEFIYFIFDKVHLINISYLIDSYAFVNVLFSQYNYYHEIYLSERNDEVPIYRRIEDVTIFQDEADGWLIPLSCKSNELLYYGNANYDVLANNNIKPQVLLLQGKLLQGVTETDITSLNNVFSSPFASRIYWKDENGVTQSTIKLNDDKLPLPSTDLFMFFGELFRYFLVYTLRPQIVKFSINYGMDPNLGVGLVKPDTFDYNLDGGLNLVDLGATVSTRFDSEGSVRAIIDNGFNFSSDNSNEDYFLNFEPQTHPSTFTTTAQSTYKQVVLLEFDLNFLQWSCGSIASQDDEYWDKIWQSNGCFQTFINDLSPNQYQIQAQLTQGANRYRPCGLTSNAWYTPFSQQPRSCFFIRAYSMFGGFCKQASSLTVSAEVRPSVTGYDARAYTNQATFAGLIGNGYRHAFFPLMTPIDVDEYLFYLKYSVNVDILPTLTARDMFLYKDNNNVNRCPKFVRSLYKNNANVISGDIYNQSTWKLGSLSLTKVAYTFIGKKSGGSSNYIDVPPDTINDPMNVDMGFYDKVPSLFEVTSLDTFTFLQSCNDTLMHRMTFFTDAVSAANNPTVPLAAFITRNNALFKMETVQKATDVVLRIFKNDFVSFIRSLANSSPEFTLCTNCNVGSHKDSLLNTDYWFEKTLYLGSLKYFGNLCPYCHRTTYAYLNMFLECEKKLKRTCTEFSLVWSNTVEVVYDLLNTPKTIGVAPMLTQMNKLINDTVNWKTNFRHDYAFGITRQNEIYMTIEPIALILGIGLSNGVSRLRKDYSIYFFNNLLTNFFISTDNIVYDTFAFTPNHMYGYIGLAKRGVTTVYSNDLSGFFVFPYTSIPRVHWAQFKPNNPFDWATFLWAGNGRTIYGLQYCENSINEAARGNTGQFFVDLCRNLYCFSIWDFVNQKWVDLEWKCFGDYYTSAEIFENVKSWPYVMVHVKFRFLFPTSSININYNPAARWFGLTSTTTTPSNLVTEFCRRVKVIAHGNEAGTSNYTKKTYSNEPLNDSRLPLITYHKHIKWIHDLYTDTKWDNFEFSWLHTNTSEFNKFLYAHPILYNKFDDIVLFNRIVSWTDGNVEANTYGRDAINTAIDTWNDIVIRVQNASLVGPITTTNLSNFPEGVLTPIYQPSSGSSISISLIMVRRYDAQFNTNLRVMVDTTKWILNANNNQDTSPIFRYFFDIDNPTTIRARITLNDTSVLNRFIIPSVIIDNSSGVITDIFLAKEYLVGNKLKIKDDDVVPNIDYTKGDYWVLNHNKFNSYRGFKLYDLETYNYQSQNGEFWNGKYQTSYDDTDISLAYFYSTSTLKPDQRFLVYESIPLIDALLVSNEFLDWEMHVDLGRNCVGVILLNADFNVTTSSLFPGQTVYTNNLPLRLPFSEDYDYYVEIVYPVRKQFDTIVFSDSTYTYNQPTLCYFNSAINPQICFRGENISSLRNLFIKTSAQIFKVFIYATNG